MEKKTVGQKFKGHLTKHKSKYITGGLVVAGVGVGVYLGNKGIINMQFINTGTVNQHLNIDKSINVLSRRGHAGNVVRCVETGETFASQNRAAELLGINKTDLSKHLRGLKDSVDGLTFTKCGHFNIEEPIIFDNAS